MAVTAPDGCERAVAEPRELIVAAVRLICAWPHDSVSR